MLGLLLGGLMLLLRLNILGKINFVCSERYTLLMPVAVVHVYL